MACTRHASAQDAASWQGMQVQGGRGQSAGGARAGDRPYLISGADDKLVKVWDFQTKACVQTLEGHSHNVSAVCFHPELPIIVSGSEDGSVRVWHATTYRLENTLNYGLERLWALGYARGSNLCAPHLSGCPCVRRCHCCCQRFAAAQHMQGNSQKLFQLPG